jgi:hypothetical protein
LRNEQTTPLDQTTTSQLTPGQIETRDRYTFCAVGVLEVTPRRTALVWHDGEGGRSHLVFGAVSKLIKSIEAIEDQVGQQ